MGHFSPATSLTANFLHASTQQPNLVFFRQTALSLEIPFLLEVKIQATVSFIEVSFFEIKHSGPPCKGIVTCAADLEQPLHLFCGELLHCRCPRPGPAACLPVCQTRGSTAPSPCLRANWRGATGLAECLQDSQAVELSNKRYSTGTKHPRLENPPTERRCSPVPQP